MSRVLLSSVLVLAAACGGPSGSPADRAAKAAELGVTAENFAGADPLLLAMAADSPSLAAALSLAKAHPKAAKRQLRFEASVMAMDCVSEFGGEAAVFDNKILEDYSMRVAMMKSGETPKQWEAFEPEMTTRLKAGLHRLIDFDALVPAEMAETIRAGVNDKKTDMGSTQAECAELAKRMKQKKYDFR